MLSGVIEFSICKANLKLNKRETISHLTWHQKPQIDLNSATIIILFTILLELAAIAWLCSVNQIIHSLGLEFEFEFEYELNKQETTENIACIKMLLLLPF